jgi:hypothetical protein
MSYVTKAGERQPTSHSLMCGQKGEAIDDQSLPSPGNPDAGKFADMPDLYEGKIDQCVILLKQASRLAQF